jgi:hypothetical protein
VVRFGNDAVMESLPDILRQIRSVALQQAAIPSSERIRGW